MDVKDLSETKILKHIKKLIKNSYEFIGYIEFANQINKVAGDKSNKSKMAEKNKDKFSDRLLLLTKFIISEHKIISLGKTKIKIVEELLKTFHSLVTYADNMKLFS